MTSFGLVLCYVNVAEFGKCKKRGYSKNRNHLFERNNYEKKKMKIKKWRFFFYKLVFYPEIHFSKLKTIFSSLPQEKKQKKTYKRCSIEKKTIGKEQEKIIMKYNIKFKRKLLQTAKLN